MKKMILLAAALFVLPTVTSAQTISYVPNDKFQSMETKDLSKCLAFAFISGHPEVRSKTQVIVDILSDGNRHSAHDAGYWYGYFIGRVERTVELTEYTMEDFATRSTQLFMTQCVPSV